MSELRALLRLSSEVSRAVRETYPSGGGGEVMGRSMARGGIMAIDDLAEKVILRSLEEQGLDWNVISEERGSASKGSDVTLIMDPIDGTHNAIRDIPFYSTSLALIGEGHQCPSISVVENIPSRRVFHAIEGDGAYCDGARIRTRGFQEEGAYVSSYLSRGSLRGSEGLFSWPSRCRYFGCISLEMCMVASGSLDVFALFSRPPRMTDLAAASLILSEAGGRTYLIDDAGGLSEYSVTRGAGAGTAVLSVGDPNAIKRIMELSKLKACPCPR